MKEQDHVALNSKNWELRIVDDWTTLKSKSHGGIILS